MIKITYSSLILNTLNGKRYESFLSTRDRSVRELKLGPHRISHRFPIKNGVTGASLLYDNISKNNALLERLKRTDNGP